MWGTHAQWCTHGSSYAQNIDSNGCILIKNTYREEEEEEVVKEVKKRKDQEEGSEEENKMKKRRKKL